MSVGSMLRPVWIPGSELERPEPFLGRYDQVLMLQTVSLRGPKSAGTPPGKLQAPIFSAPPSPGPHAPSVRFPAVEPSRSSLSSSDAVFFFKQKTAYEIRVSVPCLRTAQGMLKIEQLGLSGVHRLLRSLDCL